MFQPGIKFDKDFWARIERAAAAAGYSSPQEFVRHVLERELARLDAAGEEKEIVDRLKGLGYIE